ncbi:MAG TPA: AarF/ABC1/UbiB kinase family protein [Thermoleophilaceae bacterium]|jgi:predicted unusual protein kinase regulating ubiquinone biosynthesis (AarF/ABC1/UbiB family)
MARNEKPIPRGRVRRTARVGGLVGGQAARAAATRAANVVRSEEARREALERRYMEAAEQIVEVLGTMKGAAMKVGQVVSFLDVEFVPPEYRDQLQAKLAELQSAAPSVGFRDMRRVIEDDLDQPLDEVFAEFDQAAVASASIGQVYRARLHDGRRVAVKVQYPGVAQAVRADMQNLGMLLRLAKRIAPGLDPKALAEEIRERITDECDYELEAQAHRAFARDWRGHPFVLVPEVVTGLSRERVLVTEWVEGRPFDQVKRLPQEDRDRFGEILVRFFIGSLYRTGHFSADPHPGNYLLMDDGRVAFLDFGMNKKLPRERIEAERRWIKAAMERDADAVRAEWARLGFFDGADEAVTPERLLNHIWALSYWYFEDREFTVTREVVAEILVDAGDPRSEYWDLMRHETIPPDHAFAQRMAGLVFAVLGQLGARNNWHRVVREYIYRDPPVTPLGEAEAEFWSGRRQIPA